MQTSAPIKIEIQLEQPKVEAPPAALETRFAAAKPLMTLEEIDQKLMKAEQKRNQITQLKCSAEQRLTRQEKSRK